VQQLLGNFGRFRKEKLVGEDEREPLLDKELAWPFPTTNKDILSPSPTTTNQINRVR